jgi:CubicO group peptidase (beta-lactamase class C family)
MGDLTQNITDLMDNYLAQGYPPGVAVAAYSGNESLELTIGRGVANKESGLKAGPEVIFELGSVTKVFTATLLALQPSILDDPLSKHLPVKINNPCVEQVTLKQLATHTAGFLEDVPKKIGGDGKDGAIYLFQDQYPPADSALVNFWNQWKPTDKLGDNYCWPCQVGTCWQYSNVGFVTLGYAVAGNQYNTQLAAQITGPQQLNMPSTGALPPSGAKLAQGYMKGGNKAPGEAADMKSNAIDMLTWLKAQLTLIKMPPPLNTAILATQDTFFTSASQCCQSGHAIEFNMGLGWQIRTLQLQGANQNLYVKDGASGLGGQSCWVGFVPSQNAGVAVLTNGIGADQPPPVLGMQVLDALLGLSVNLQPAEKGH